MMRQQRLVSATLNLATSSRVVVGLGGTCRGGAIFALVWLGIWAGNSRLHAQSRPAQADVRQTDDLRRRLRALEDQLNLNGLITSGDVPAPLSSIAVVPDGATGDAPSTPADGDQVATDAHDPAGSPPESTETRLPFSGYMDFHYHKPRGEPGELDFHRFVLLFAHSFTDRIKFWSELEVEHAFLSAGSGGNGEVALEQAYLDFLVTPALNFRAGMLLAPVGLINERHEPPTYNGVERPFVDAFIIPTTWFDTGAGLVGELGKGFSYRAYLMAPLNAAKFSADEGLRDASQNGSKSVLRDPAWTGRLEYRGVRRLALGASFWRGRTGFALRGLNPAVAVVAVDGRYSVSRLDFRGEFANVSIGAAGALNALVEQRTGDNPNIASTLRGFYLESAARILPRGFAHDLVVFGRHENFDTQHRMPDGYLPLRQFDRSAWVIGATFYPEPDIALKIDYSLLRNRSAVVKPVSSFNLGIGWWF